MPRADEFWVHIVSSCRLHTPQGKYLDSIFPEHFLSRAGNSESMYSALPGHWTSQVTVSLIFSAWLSQKPDLFNKDIKRDMEYVRKSLEFYAVMAVPELPKQILKKPTNIKEADVLIKFYKIFL